MSKHSKTSTASFHPLSAPDFLPLPQLRDLQLQRLKAIVQRAYDHVALFRKRLDDRGITPQDVRTLEDITKLPFAEKTDLRDTYPFGLFASPMAEIVRLHASSGTTGKPIVVAYTQKDVQVWTNVMLRSFAACGLHEGDIIQNAYGYGLFTGGLGAHYGAEALGATVIPISGGNTPRQLMVMKDFGVTAICCTPSYFLHLIDQAPEVGVNLKELPLRAGIFGAEPWTESMRRRIEAESGIKAYDIYGLSEIIGPGVAMECQCQSGSHIFEDYFYPEIINLKTGKPCPDGEEGELVLTTLGKKAMPMIRYRTRDITALASETCECGRTLRRLKRIGRRADDMFIIRGVNVYPSQIETALLKVEGTLPHYQIVLTREKDLDVMEVQVEVTPEVFADTVGALEQLQTKLTKTIETTVGVRAGVRLVQPRTIQRSEGKAKRVIDQRKLQPQRESAMKFKQLSLFLENKTGALSRPIKLIAKAKLNILTLSIADTQQFGILRFVVRDWAKAKRLLEKEGFVVKVSDMVAIEVDDEPGALANILVTLEKARVNLEYMYGFTLKKQGKGVLAFRFDDPDSAIAALQKKKITPISGAELFRRLEN